jgi:hypothetical protein
VLAVIGHAHRSNTHTHTHTHMDVVSAMSSGFLPHNPSQARSSSLKQGGGGSGFLQGGKGGGKVLHSDVEAKKRPGCPKVLTPRFRDFF